MKYLGAVLINYEKTRMMVSKLWNVFRMLSQAMKDLGTVLINYEKTRMMVSKVCLEICPF